VDDVIEEISFRGARRVPQDTLRALIISRKGDKLDPETLHRDFMALWNQGRFDDITLEQEPGRSGWVVTFRLTERRVVRSIKYDGMKSITVSEILDRFKERRVGLSVEQQYDPARVQRAAIVLKEYLSERGRQFATVEPQVVQIPPSSLEVKFLVKEGPKVKVGDIAIEGNTSFKDNAIIRAMKNSRPIGIPYSVFLEKLFAKSFDSTKLEQDKDMIRDFYQQRGYFTARAVEHTSTIRDTGGNGFKLPLFYPNKPGKVADLKVMVEEGKLYRMANMNFNGVKLFRTPETIFPKVFQMEKGDIFSTTKLRKGLEQMRKIYGEFGYIDFVPEPDFAPDAATGTIDLNLSVDEGKQFFLRRLDFQGNTTTRDKVIRREILLDEGQVYNTRYWELSLLRLNQLGYFEALKENEAADIKRDTRTNTVDITLKVKERGKNSVQLNGGVSGIAGSFIGFGYSTNNFLGLGETLSLDAQLGDRIRNVTLGFTEPYLFDRPITSGFTIYTTRFNYDQGREVSLLTGRNLIPLYNQLGSNNLLNYVSNGYGFTTFLSSPWRRSFARGRTHLQLRDAKDQHRFDVGRDVFQIHQLPGPERAEPARRHQDERDHPIVYLQHGGPSDHALAWPEHLSHHAIRHHRRQCPHDRAQRRPQIFQTWIQEGPRDRHARSGPLCHRLFRPRGAAVQPLLHGRRKRHPRLRDLADQSDCLYPDPGERAGI
jgi:outer membrane protein insertion porin family